MAANDTMDNFSAVLHADDQTNSMNEQGVDNESIAVVVMLSIFSVVGVIGNAIAFYIFFGRRSSSTSVIFILALAGTDFFTCLVTIPYTIIFELIKYYLVYDMACKTYMFLITSTVPFSAYIMVGIALDRYFCICHPFLFVFTLARAKAVIFCMCIPAVVFGVITALSHGTYVYAWHMQTSESNSTTSRTTGEYIFHSMSADEIDYYQGTNNTTNVTAQLQIVPFGVCHNNTFIFSQAFLEVYKKIHALNFLVAYVAVAVLYILIYKSIFTRRANKARRRKENNVYATAGNKFKDNQQEETQMTVINGADSNSPKAVNKQMRKDAKSARKITHTARNDPSAFSKTESQRLSNNATGTSEEKEEERVSLLDENHEVWNNETNGNSSNVSTCNTTSTTCGLITEGEDVDDEDGCGVYIGPQTYVRKLSPNQGFKVSCEKNTEAAEFESGHIVSSVPNHTADKLLGSLVNCESGQPTDCQVHNEEPTTVVASTICAALEGKPLLPQLPQTHATPPNSLALISNVSRLFSSQTEVNKTPEAGCRRQPAAKHPQSDTQANSLKRKRPSTVRDRTLMANMKTAFMLFIVTLVFIIAFLPALLMANGLIKLNLIVFYSYFIYNVANPFIYAFMNQTFREDLKKLVNVCRRRTS